MGQLDGKAALVTGGSRGIGAAIVRRLAADGAQVTFTYASSSSAADEVVSAVKEAGGQAVAVQADQSDVAALSSVFDTASVDGGRIITVSTLNTALPAPGISLYAASKAGLEQFTKIAAREYGARGITANVVSPGATDTDMFRDSNPPEIAEMLVGMTPLGRVGEPADVADVVAFLAGPDGRWLTGQNLRATGGLVL